MNNIKRIIDALISFQGSHVVLGTVNPIFVVKGQQRIPLMKKELNERELSLLLQELSQFTGGADRLVVSDKLLWVVAKGGEVEIQLRSGHDVPQEGINTQSAVPIKEPDRAETAKVEAPRDDKKKQPNGGILERLERLLVECDPSNIDGLLLLMVKVGASDLHLSSACTPYFRIDGEMWTLDHLARLDSEALWGFLLPIIPERNREEFLSRHDTDFAYEISGVGRFRSNIFKDHKGVGAVFRLIPSKILDVETLKVPSVMIDLCKMPKGLILVTGPTGSGKSTTLASLIDHINKTQRKHIITIEDPVEFVHPNQLSLVNQRELHSHTESFKKALRAALREDPDIILVGEMRDLETIAIAIEMAVTGHLVFGTLHTSTAVTTVDRIIDQFPSDQQAQIRTMLADALVGVVSQMLLKKKGGGRIAAYEVMVSSIAVSNLIREGKTYQITTLMQTGKKLGQQMLNAHLSQLVNEGIVEAEEALDKAIDKENLKAQIRGGT